jgi:hypothetical protein
MAAAAAAAQQHATQVPTRFHLLVHNVQLVTGIAAAAESAVTLSAKVLHCAVHCHFKSDRINTSLAFCAWLLLQAGQGTTDRYGFCIKMGPMDQVRPRAAERITSRHMLSMLSSGTH